MVRCSICQKPIEKLPEWLSHATVQFVCLNCPKRQHKNSFQGTSIKEVSSKQAEFLEEEDLLDDKEED